jgi:hypothetical protein
MNVSSKASGKSSASGVFNASEVEAMHKPGTKWANTHALLLACIASQPGMCPAEGTGDSASFSSLPTHVQTLIFASAGACLTTCKGSAGLAQDARLTAEWLLQQHLPEPLGRAARHQL